MQRPLLNDVRDCADAARSAEAKLRPMPARKMPEPASPAQAQRLLTLTTVVIAILTGLNAFVQMSKVLLECWLRHN